MGFCSDGADITFETHVLPLRMSKTTLSRYGWADLGTVSLSLSLSINGRLPLLSHLISLRRSLGNMLTQPTQGSYPKHGKVTRIPNTMEINNINNFAPHDICTIRSALLNFLPWMQRCVYARPVTRVFIYMLICIFRDRKGGSPLAPINLYGRDCAINAQTYSFLKNDL